MMLQVTLAPTAGMLPGGLVAAFLKKIMAVERRCAGVLLFQGPR
jgi:hypothetical protein